MTFSRKASLRALFGAAIAPSLLPFERVASAATTQLQFVGLPVDGCKALFYGVQSGIFRKYDLDIQPRVMNSGPAATAALVRGSADVVLSNIVTLIQGVERGIPLRAIAASGLNLIEKPTSYLLVPKESPVKTAADLTGKTIGTVSLGGIFLVSLKALLDQNGGDSKSVNVVEVPLSSVTNMLDGGRVAAALSNEPAASQTLETGRYRVLGMPMAAIGKRYETAAYVVMETAVKANPDVYRRFARALHEAQIYTNAHGPETVDLVASYTGTPASVVAKSPRVSDPEYVDTRNIQPVIDVLAKYGQIKQAFSASEIISSAALKPPG